MESNSNFSYKIDVTSAITDVNGATAEEYSIDFTTGLISKAPHKEGKAIELVSIGKTAYRNERQDRNRQLHSARLSASHPLRRSQRDGRPLDKKILGNVKN